MKRVIALVSTVVIAMSALVGCGSAKYKDGTYKVLNGTSMATPHVAGLAALFKEKNPGATLSDFRNILQTTSTDLGDSVFDIEYGYGLPDAVSLLQ